MFIQTIKNLRFFFAVLALCSTFFLGIPVKLSGQIQTENQTDNVNNERLTVSFEENRGQFPEAVRFFARTGGANVFLMATEVVYVLPLQEDEEKVKKGIEDSTSSHIAHALKMKIVGANEYSDFAGEQIQEQKTNYFKGAEENWKTDIRNFGNVRYENVYDGIGMLWHGLENGATRYDFIVAPNADTNQIALEFDGADNIELDADGNLLIHTAAGIVKHNKPFSYQESNGAKQEIKSRFIIEQSKVENRKSKIKFQLGEYDRSKPLTIDPTVTLNNLAFSTMLGSSGDDIANDIAVDASGNTYITGRTLSPAFPTTAGTFDTSANGAEDVFVTKINASGTNIVFSTFLGGTFFDEGRGIAIDTSGNIYVAGVASSSFPITGGAFDTTFNGAVDVFVTKLNSTGSALLYSTYIGGVFTDSATDLAIDATGNSYLAVRTSDASPGVNYPTTAGAFDTTHNGTDDVAVTKLNPTGTSLVYSTFLGGSSIDFPSSIAINAGGEVYINGGTDDGVTDFPTNAGSYDTTHNGANDVFVTRLSADGATLVYSTFIGGASIDNGFGLAIDAGGNAYVSGQAGTGFPTTAGVFDTVSAGGSEGFLSKLSPNGATLIYSSFIGGTQNENIQSLAVDNFGNAYLTGNNFGGDFPTTGGAFDTTQNGSTDIIFTVVNSAATAIVYSTYLGGGGIEFGNDIALDTTGNVYLTGQTTAVGAVFPTNSQAFQNFNAGGNDAFVTKFGNFAISGRVIDTNGNPLSSVMIAMSGQTSDFIITGADGRFGFTNTVAYQPHTVAASRSGYNINPSLFNIATLDNNRELIFIGTPGTPTGGSGGTLRFENLSYNKAENGATVTVTVKRTGILTEPNPVTVDFTTVGGTAVEGQDFTATSGVLTFNILETTKTITIPLLNDAILEPRESFSISLNNPTNNAEIENGRSSTNIQILDEDLSNGSLIISEFRQRGRLGANDEYIKLFNPNDFDVTIQTADNSNGLTIVRSNSANLTSVATIPNFVTIRSRGHYLLTNNNPNGGFSLIDYPTGNGGTTTAVGDQTFSADIPDNSNLVLLKTSDAAQFNQTNLLDAVGFGATDWKEGNGLSPIGAENSEMSFVRKLNANGLQDTNNNQQDFLLVDNHATIFALNGQKNYSALGAPAPETSESLRLMTQSEVSIEDYGSEVFNPTPVPNGSQGTLTVYRRITNNTNQPILALRLRAIDFPTAGTLTQKRFSSRPDFRLLNSMDEGEIIKGVTLAAERLQPNGGGINSTLTINAITQNNPLPPNESVIVAIRFGVMRYGRHPLSLGIEALQ